ncbi:histidine phosphatase family protein [Nocardiopsis tropica]|uniref:histidine phosphatase family protein n=1 Tax=Nocardiopsis tropica TaxID=109330 RepID=UPI002E8CCF54|nr:histidine phosphatase family protein [Nocardiopsis tropica]
MADLYLMRHGHYVGHRPGYHAPDDAELSPRGRREAIVAAQVLPPVAAIVSSPLPRALQTAKLLTKHSGIPLLEPVPDLREWRSPTAVQGLPPDEFPEDYTRWRVRRTLDPTNRYRDGESLQELSERAACARTRLSIFVEQEGSLLVVSHTLFLSMFISTEPAATAFSNATRSPWSFLEIRHR